MRNEATKGMNNRLERAQAELSVQGADWLLIPHSMDLRYLIGYAHRQSERLTLLLVPNKGRPRMVLPSFEIPVVQAYADHFDLIGWDEDENPVEKVSQVVGTDQTILIGEPLHARILLRLQSALSSAHFLSGESVMAALRMIKEPDELDALRDAARSADQALEALLDQPLTDMTEREVIHYLHEHLLENGNEAVGTGIVGSGSNSASPHHRTSERQLRQGEALVIDFGGSVRGYRSDMTRTLHLGELSDDDEFRRVYQIVQEAQELAFDAVRVGAKAGEIDSVARQYIADQGYGPNFLHRTGHGIGLEGHEMPYIVEGSEVVLEQGMTFSVEPGIYLDGRFGVRIEDIVCVTQAGAARLNQFPRDLLIVA